MTKTAKIYHGQATTDKYAKKDDYFYTGVPTVSTKQIKEAYKEFIEDLMMEAQEAY